MTLTTVLLRYGLLGFLGTGLLTASVAMAGWMTLPPAWFWAHLLVAFVVVLLVWRPGEALVPRRPVSDEEALGLLQTADGLRWSSAFCRATGFPDRAWADTWFCNACQAGYDAGQRACHALDEAGPR